MEETNKGATFNDNSNRAVVSASAIQYNQGIKYHQAPMDQQLRAGLNVM